MSVVEVGLHMGLEFRKVTWREGCKGKLSSRFTSCRVRPVHHTAGGADDEEVWLLIEWPANELVPSKFWLATLPKNTTRKQLVRLVKERYRTERVYEDLKGELGLDHFEGRTFRGWHHHVTVALSCFAFIVAERVRRFSPRCRPQENDDAIQGETRAPLSRVLHHRASGLRSTHRQLAAEVPAVPQAQ
jgi:SRSO17 transposase